MNLGTAGANYGWPSVEGPNPAGQAGVRYPLHFYQNAGSNCRGERLTISRRGQSRSRARRRARAVVGTSDENRVHEPAFTRRGLTVVMYLYQYGFEVGDLWYASGIGWTLALVLMGLTMIQRMVSRER